MSSFLFSCTTGQALARRILRWQIGCSALWTRQCCWQPTSASVASQAFLVSFMAHSIHSHAKVALETWSIAAAPANSACVITYPLLAADVGDVLAEATRLGFGDAVAVSAETGVHYMH